MKKSFPIYRDAYALVVQIEQVVRNFDRYHKYTIGSEMRAAAYQLLEQITHAINNKAARINWVMKAHLSSEALKIKIQIAKTLNLYQSFKQFELISRLAVSTSKQCNAWQTKLQHPRQQVESHE